MVEFDSAGNPVGAPTGSGLDLGLDRPRRGLRQRSTISNRGQTNVAVLRPGGDPARPQHRQPARRRQRQLGRDPQHRRLPGQPLGQRRRLHLDPAADRLRQRRPPRGLPLRRAADTLDCASCNPTGEQATGEATLASNGSSLTDDGRVFFNSTEGLVDRDLNGKMDAYEWEPQEPPGQRRRTDGCVQLISTGTSPLDSSLLGVSADGTDAYFFTHDTLVSSDNNGSRVKIYDARAGGGFAQVPPPHPCQASDECHGAGSQAPPPPDIKTIAGTPAATRPSRRRARQGSSRSTASA